MKHGPPPCHSIVMTRHETKASSHKAGTVATLFFVQFSTPYDNVSHDDNGFESSNLYGRPFVPYDSNYQSNNNTQQSQATQIQQRQLSGGRQQLQITSGKENANTSAENSQNRQSNVDNRWNAQNEAIDEKEKESNKNVDPGDTVESNFVATSPLIKHICRRCQQSFLSNNSLHRHLRSDHYAKSTPKESAKPPPPSAPLRKMSKQDHN